MRILSTKSLAALMSLFTQVGIMMVSFLGCSYKLKANSPELDHASLHSGIVQKVIQSVEQIVPLSESNQELWKELKQELQKIGEIETLETIAFEESINSILTKLNISHLQLRASVSGRSGTRQMIRSMGTGYTGMELTWVNNQWYVHSIHPDSTLNSTSIKPGDIITHIGPWELIADHSNVEMEYIHKSLQANFGPEHTTFAIRGFHADGMAFEEEGTFIPWPFEWSKSFGNLPSLPIQMDIKKEANYTFIRFNYFVFDLLDQLRSAIESTPEGNGLILDLRGNTGGMAIMANSLAGKLASESYQFGTMQLKGGWMAFFADPQPPVFTGKTAVLIDEFSASTSEILALGLQDSNRAKVFGSVSMGAALPSKFVPLTSGFMLQLPIATYKSTSGYVIEGKGVVPDQIVSYTQDDLINQKDPVVSQAVRWLLSDSNPTHINHSTLK